MTIPSNRESIQRDGIVTPAWYRFLSQLAKPVEVAEQPPQNSLWSDLVGRGFLVRNSIGAAVFRKIAGVTGRTVVTSDDGNDGNPTIDLAEVVDVGGGTLQKTDVDAYGRVIGTSAATTSDLSEGSNLYFTDARAIAAVGGAGTFQRIDGNGDIRIDGNGDLRISS